MPTGPDLVVAALGWAAIPLVVLRFQVQGFTCGLWIGAAAGGLSALYLALIGAASGALVAVTVALSMSLQAALGRRLHAALRYAIALTAIAVAVGLKEPGGGAWLPVAAFAMTRLAEANRHDLGLRCVMCLASALWVVYGADAGAWPVVAGNMISIGSNGWGIRRFHLRAPLSATPVPTLRLSGR